MYDNRRQSWHHRPTSELVVQLATDALRGLTPEEAVQRLHTGGPNELRKGKAISPLAILAGQFRSLVIGVLIGAALVSIALGELADGVAILAIVLLNAVIGFFRSIAPSGRWPRWRASRLPEPGWYVAPTPR